MKYLKYNVKNMSITRDATDKTQLVSGAVNYFGVSFVMDEEFSNLPGIKAVEFFKNRKPIRVDLVENCCAIPNEFLRDKAPFEMRVVSGTTVGTTWFTVNITEGGEISADEPENVPEGTEYIKTLAGDNSVALFRVNNGALEYSQNGKDWTAVLGDTIPASNTPKDKLDGKTILFLGDSLMAGNGWTGGYVNCIKENHPNVNIQNVAVTGTLLYGGQIYEQFTAYKDNGGVEPDIIVFNGGINDCVNHVELGTAHLSDTYPRGGHATTSDAVEEFIYGMRATYPRAKLLYVSAPPMHQWGDGTDNPGVPTPEVQLQYLNEIEKVCMKYSVPVADVFRSGNVASVSQKQMSEFFLSGDTIHLNESGYRAVAPVIEDALVKLV